MTLPPWMRAIQQSPYFHVAQSAALSAGVTYMTCNPAAQAQSCVEVAVAAFVGALYLSFQHSPWSTSFKINGDPIPAAAQLKELADNAATIQVKANDPTIPEVTQADANKAANALNQITVAVAMQNQIVKTALENEAKP